MENIAMKRLVTVAFMCIMLTSCSAMDLLKGFAGGESKKGHGNDNELVVGDSNKGIDTGDETTQKARDVKGDQATTQYKGSIIGITWWQALLVGLFIPSPVVIAIRWLKRKLSNGSSN